MDYLAPVIFLHGVAGSRRTYDWLPAAVSGHEVVRPDFRGHGDAARTPGAYLISDYAADAVEVLRSVGPAFVVGHSLGGVAAWWAAQLVPELVLGAVLEDPPLFAGSPEGHASNGAIPRFRHLRSIAAAWQSEGITEAVALERLATEPGADAAMPDATAARAYSLLHLDPTVLDTVIDGSLLAATDVDATIEVPMSILAAGVEPAFTPAHAQRMAASHPAIEIVTIAGAGHSIHDERAHRELYLAHVAGFLTARVAAARS